MKALSVRAPWWWAILHGKPVENRGWYTNFRGVVLLHASKHWSRREIEDDLEDTRYMAEQDCLNMPEPDLAWMLECGGCIVGSVEVVECVTEHPSAFFVGKFGFVLRHPVTYRKPIPFKGTLGFFDVPDSIVMSQTDEFIDEVGPLPTCNNCGLAVGICDCKRFAARTQEPTA